MIIVKLEAVVGELILSGFGLEYREQEGRRSGGKDGYRRVETCQVAREDDGQRG